MKNLFKKLILNSYGRYFNTLVLFSKRKAAITTFQVFSKVRKGRVLPNQKKYLDAVKDTTLRIEDHDIQTYKWNGTKDRILLVHGWESNTFRWRNLVEKLTAENYEVIAFDAPGHGYSSGSNLHLPLYTECIQKIIETHSPKHIIAHSFGGMAILFNDYLYQNDGIEKMVTIGSPSEFRELLDHYQKLIGFNNRVLKAFENYVYERFQKNVDDFSSSKFVLSNQKEGLLLHDKLDVLAPFHASEKVHADWKNSKFIKTKGFGHSMHQPELNDQIIAFLKSEPIKTDFT